MFDFNLNNISHVSLYYLKFHALIGLMRRVFANGPRDIEFNPWSSHTKVLDTALVNTQHL